MYTVLVQSTYSDIAPIPKQMTIVMGLAVVGLMAFGLAISYYKNILFDRQLLAMQERNLRLKHEIMNGYGQLQYLQSEQYKDKYAKENFGLLKPGEKVLILNLPATQDVQSSATELTPEEKEAIFETNLRSIRVVDHWRLFLFERSQIDDLKKGSL
jgi:cell division protein FtsB